VAHNTNETQEYIGVGKQCKTLGKGGVLTVVFLFFNMGSSKPQEGYYRNSYKEQEEKSQPQLEDMPEEVKQAQAEHEARIAKEGSDKASDL